MTAKTESNLVYIIPAHKKDHRLLYAIDSVLSQSLEAKCIVVGPAEVYDYVTKKISKEQRSNILFGDIPAEGDTSYQALINIGLDVAKGAEDIEWVSFLEFDDKLLPAATQVFNDFKNGYPDDSAFAGLALVVDPTGERTPEDESSPPQLKAMANEAAWAATIMETVGVFDFNAMLRMNFMFLNGCFFKLEILDQIGNLKPNMKYYYDYEFLLRVVYNGYDIRSIPKATHYHFTNGEAITDHQNSAGEVSDFWGNQARKEYFFEFDRDITPPTPVAEQTATE